MRDQCDVMRQHLVPNGFLLIQKPNIPLFLGCALFWEKATIVMAFCLFFRYTWSVRDTN